MNIAIFGGSFDPPHIGHEAIINKSLDTLDIDKLLIVPTFLNPFKEKFHFTPQERFDLLKHLFISDKLEVSNYEIKQNIPTPTIHTVKHFIKLYKPNKIYLIVGADNFPKLHLWQNFEQLKELVTFVIISRDNKKLKDDIIQFIEIKLDINISSTKLRESMDLNFIPKKIQQKVKKLWKID